MGIAQQAAAEIDRLVLTLNQNTASRHGARLREQAAQVGLDSLELLPHFEDWLVAGRLTQELALTRLRYRPERQVLDRLATLVTGGYIENRETGYAATERLRPLLQTLLDVRAEEAARSWDGHSAEVEVVSRLGRLVADAASDDHLVAVSHRQLPDPENRYLRLEHRLFTLRYVRQHDHAEAWLAHGLTAAEMGPYTALWSGRDPDPGPALDSLFRRGLVAPDPPHLTERGRTLREAIEGETNRRAQLSFDVLDDGQAHDLLNALRTLPDGGAEI